MPALVNLSFKFEEIMRQAGTWFARKDVVRCCVWSSISNSNIMRIAQFINVCAFDVLCSAKFTRVRSFSFSFPLILLLILLYQTG